MKTNINSGITTHNSGNVNSDTIIINSNLCNYSDMIYGTVKLSNVSLFNEFCDETGNVCNVIFNYSIGVKTYLCKCYFDIDNNVVTYTNCKHKCVLRMLNGNTQFQRILDPMFSDLIIANMKLQNEITFDIYFECSNSDEIINGGFFTYDSCIEYIYSNYQSLRDCNVISGRILQGSKLVETIHL